MIKNELKYKINIFYIMYVCKDIYLYILEFVDDKTAFSMLSVNKKFNCEMYFENVMIRKYPLLTKFRDPRFETWKHLFVRMSLHIYKLERKYEIPYIPTIDYNPERFYRIFQHLILGEGDNIYNYAFRLAKKGGHYKIARLMKQKGANNTKIKKILL
jgi:hypothetical protein